MRIRQSATQIWRNVSNSRLFSDAVSVCKDTVFPARCAACDDIVVPRGAPVCASCKKNLRELPGVLCMKCGNPLDERKEDAEYCEGCRSGKHTFDRAFSVFDYSFAAPSLYRFKYLGRQEYAAYYAERFVRRHGGMPYGVKAEALVPVPLHPSRQRQRGYNQAEAFARALSGLLDIPVRTDLVARVKKTKPQKNLDYYGRLNNLKNAFIVNKNDVECKSVALTDDIYTTGSTADELAALLKKHGVDHVYVFTAATATKCFSEGGM